MSFSSIIPQWRKTREPWTLEMLIDPNKNPIRFTLQERDLEILQGLLEHRFLTSPQLHRLFFTEGSGGARYTQQRLKIFYDIGLVMKVRPQDLDPGTKPNVFALTTLGYQLLTLVGRIESGDRSFFYNESENLVEFSFIIHELNLNEICLSLFDECEKKGFSFEWLPTKLCRQQVRDAYGKNRIVEPDAIFLFYTPNEQVVLHLEYERSADPRRFKQKLERWKLYRNQQVWKERYETEPIICVVGDREGWSTGGRKRRVVNSIQPLLHLALNEGFPNICFLPTDEIEDKTYCCLPYRGKENTLWEILKLE